jgi:hypothetical protein
VTIVVLAAISGLDGADREHPAAAAASIAATIVMRQVLTSRILSPFCRRSYGCKDARSKGSRSTERAERGVHFR